MENTPTPYQRCRRAGRAPEEAACTDTGAAEQTPLPAAAWDAAPVSQDMYSASPYAQAYAPGLSPAHRAPQSISQARPVQREASTYYVPGPAAESTSRPRMTSTPESRRVQPRPQSGGNPRAIRQAFPDEWAAAPRRSNPVAKKRSKPRKTPSWLTTLLCLSLIGVLALMAGSAVMQAYLKTAADEKQAAYEDILFEYHLTESADGTLRVTWQDLIERYAAEYNLDPAFVTAIIRNESSFRTYAESSVGARGLMQMMPDTAEWVAGKLNEPYDFDKLYEAETSIRYGCWYLNYLSELFYGDTLLVCAAYHAGQGEVQGWRGDKDISSDGVHVLIDDIPITNTRNYAKKVTQAYGIYEALLYSQ